MTVRMETSSAELTGSGLVDVIDTFDRPPNAEAEAKFARAGKYACEGFIDRPGKRLPKAGLYAEAGIGEASAEVCIFKAQANGPNASAGLHASVTEVGAMATAGIGKASANAGPLEATVGLQLDTGVKAGLNGVEAKFLGTGVSFGPKTSVSLFGSELSFKIF